MGRRLSRKQLEIEVEDLRESIEILSKLVKHNISYTREALISLKTEQKKVSLMKVSSIPMLKNEIFQMKYPNGLILINNTDGYKSLTIAYVEKCKYRTIHSFQIREDIELERFKEIRITPVNEKLFKVVLFNRLTRDSEVFIVGDEMQTIYSKVIGDITTTVKNATPMIVMDKEKGDTGRSDLKTCMYETVVTTKEISAF